MTKLPDDMKLTDVKTWPPRHGSRICEYSRWHGMETVGDLRRMTDDELLSIPNISKKLLIGIRATIEGKSVEDATKERQLKDLERRRSYFLKEVEKIEAEIKAL